MTGFIIGVVIATAVTAWAASRMTLEDGTGNEVGTTANPLYAQAI